jgi:predicted lipoprotein with Yx(FWY)xxD motif
MRFTPAARVAAAAAAAGLLAACGSAGTSSSPGMGASGQQGSATGMTVTEHKLPGVGMVLTDSSGKTLYSSVQEASGSIKCTGSCLSFWFPVTVAKGAKLQAASGVSGTLGRLSRPDDGKSQLTYNGKPLYTFKLDSGPGQMHGNNFKDSFGGTSFTWQAVTASGSAGTGQQGNSSGGSSGGSGGYGGSGGSSGGYGSGGY